VELRRYRHVLARADHASFRKASEALGISQPALTRSLFQIAAVVSRRPDFLADISDLPLPARGPAGYCWRIPAQTRGLRQGRGRLRRRVWRRPRATESGPEV
jgi:hypothetical protein